MDWAKRSAVDCIWLVLFSGLYKDTTPSDARLVSRENGQAECSTGVTVLKCDKGGYIDMLLSHKIVKA